MSKAYVIQTKGKQHTLVEKPTQQVIAKGKQEVLRPLCAKLNGGSGFNGNTPPFILISTKIKK
jgi:hypothetical protein